MRPVHTPPVCPMFESTAREGGTVAGPRGAEERASQTRRSQCERPIGG